MRLRHSASFYANLYKKHSLYGAHIIKLGTFNNFIFLLGNGNDEAALEALREWPNSMQIGGINTVLNVRRN